MKTVHQGPIGTESKYKIENPILLKLSTKQIKGLQKLARLWTTSPENALRRLLDKVIEESL